MRARAQWLSHLRRELPTVPFKASTQTQRKNLSRARGRATAAADEVLGSSTCVGADSLLQLVKNYSRTRKMKTGITVGVIGYPNVGKSRCVGSVCVWRGGEVGRRVALTRVRVRQCDQLAETIQGGGRVAGARLHAGAAGGGH